MKAFFQKLTSELVSLVDRQDHFAMAVRCRDHECGYILKILRSRDEADGDNAYWLFAGEFTDPAGYAAAIAAEFAARREAACEALAAEGKPAWPPLPADGAAAPAERLRALMIYARDLLPAEGDHLLVCAFFPVAIRSREAFAGMMADLMRHEFPHPWCHHMRLYVRDDSARPALYDELKARKLARVRYFAPDLSQAAMEKAVEEEAADPALPMEERMQNLLVLANLDLSHRRFEESLRKHDLLLGYAQASGNALLAALTLNGMGEVRERMGAPAKARVLFIGAMGKAVESDARPVMLNVALNLANLELKSSQWDLAETYYATAHALAAHLLNPQVKIHCLCNLGYAQYMQGKRNEAVANWEGGAALAKEMEEDGLRKQCLTRLGEHYKAARNGPKLNAVQRELAALG